MPRSAVALLLLHAHAAAAFSAAPHGCAPARRTPPLPRAPLPTATETPTGRALVYGSIGAGLAANPLAWWSLATLKGTGCGLPAGPFGLLGAAEGVAYLVVVGFVGAALVSRATRGKGLPAGPAGLLGAAEGLSFLTVAAGLVVLGFQLADYGFIPEAIPVEGGRCSGI
jgi:hypothetical protein